MPFRIGIGYDLHRLTAGSKLILGGVEIPFDKGLIGHSDADVLTHAICDAALGAMACGDIGQHFSNKDPLYKGASSLDFLCQILSLLKSKGATLYNIDATVITEMPKLAKYIKDIRINLAKVCKLSFDFVSVKAKTNEGVDAVGRGEAIAVQAVVLVITE